MDDYSFIQVPLVDLIHGSFNHMVKDMEKEVLEMRGGKEWLNFIFQPFLSTHLNYPLNDTSEQLNFYDSSNDSIICFVACYEGYPVGFVILSTEPNYVVIIALYIEKDFRKLGVGEHTLDYIISYSKDKNVSAFVFPGNKDAKNLFERFGMKTNLMIVG